MDFRIVFVFAPILVAASWALYNIGRVALQQLARIRSQQAKIKSKIWSGINVAEIYLIKKMNEKSYLIFLFRRFVNITVPI